MPPNQSLQLTGDRPETLARTRREPPWGRAPFASGGSPRATTAISGRQVAFTVDLAFACPAVSRDASNSTCTTNRFLPASTRHIACADGMRIGGIVRAIQVGWRRYG